MNHFNIIFAGTPEFAATVLQSLHSSQHTIQAVYTQPDRPAGRGRQLTASPVKVLAEHYQLPVHQPITLRDEKEQQILRDFNADVMVVVAYGLLLPKAVLTLPKLGCINIHASLLPRWRGAAPIQRAIQAGDARTGITLMQMDEGLDTGAMLYKVECPIEANDTSQILHDRLAVLGADALLKTLDKLPDLKPEIQNSDLATYAHKITKEEARINWNLSADELENQIRAFNPWPIAFFSLDENNIRVWQAKIIENSTKALPGTLIQVSQDGIDVAVGQGVLRLLMLQWPGGRPLSVNDILNSRPHTFKVGQKL